MDSRTVELLTLIIAIVSVVVAAVNAVGAFVGPIIAQQLPSWQRKRRKNAKRYHEQKIREIEEEEASERQRLTH